MGTIYIFEKNSCKSVWAYTFIFIKASAYTALLFDGKCFKESLLSQDMLVRNVWNSSNRGHLTSDISKTLIHELKQLKFLITTFS